MEGKRADVRYRSPDVLLLVLLGDLDVASVWLQVVGGDLPQDLLVHGEEHLQGALLDVVVPRESRGPTRESLWCPH